MTRAQLEAAIWQHWPTRGGESAHAVDAILGAADAYAAECASWAAWRRDRRMSGRFLLPEEWHGLGRPPGRVYHHTSDTDLHPLIRALADALLASEDEVAA